MENRKEVLSKAFKYLQSIGKAMKIKDVAAAMAPYGRRPETVSRAMNGNGDYATDQFMVDFDKSFPGIFNLSWLLTGEGDMLQPTQSAQPLEHDAIVQFLMEQIKEKDRRYDDVIKRMERIEGILQKLQNAYSNYGPLVAADVAQPYGIEK